MFVDNTAHNRMIEEGSQIKCNADENTIVKKYPNFLFGVKKNALLKPVL